MLEPFKYGGYPMLLAAVALPPDDEDGSSREGKAGAGHFLSAEKAPLLQARTLLLAHGCLIFLHRDSLVAPLAHEVAHV